MTDCGMTDFGYRVIRSGRKTLAVEIKADGTITVRAPYGVKDGRIKAFLSEKSVWIEKHLEKLRSASEREKFSAPEIASLKTRAKRVLSERAAFYADKVGVSYGKITVRAQKTLWGSCTAKGNLSFNCLLMLFPESVYDYVVAHELCHIKYMNHSRAFWQEVERVMPDYKERRAFLKRNGRGILAAL